MCIVSLVIRWFALKYRMIKVFFYIFSFFQRGWDSALAMTTRAPVGPRCTWMDSGVLYVTFTGRMWTPAPSVDSCQTTWGDLKPVLQLLENQTSLFGCLEWSVGVKRRASWIVKSLGIHCTLGGVSITMMLGSCASSLVRKLEELL